MGDGTFGAGRELRLFIFFFHFESYPTFVPRENEIPIKTGDTGNFVQLSSFCCDSKAKERNLG